MQIRLATTADAAAIRNIYGQYIDTPITFEYSLPTQLEFSQRISETLIEYPYLACCTEQGQVVGYAYAHRHMQREAYQWKAELSVYLDRAFRAQGLGTALYGVLLDLLGCQGIRTVYGGVTLPNKASERLHQSLGFHPVGIYRKAGYKCNTWHDVAWFEKEILPHTPSPSPMLPFCKISKQAVDGILAKHSHPFG